METTENTENTDKMERTEKTEKAEKPLVDELDVFVEKAALTRKLSGPSSVSTGPSSNPGSPRYHHRPPRRAASERRRSRHHHHHHHHHERKGSVMASTSHGGAAGLEGRRTSRVGDRRMSHALGDTSLMAAPRSRTSSISDHRRLSAADSSSVPQRKPSERRPSNGPYMSPGLNMAGSYRTPGAEITVASLIITVGLVALIVSFTTGTRIWLIVGSVCMALGGMFLVLGLCWYCAKIKEKPRDESRELRVVTNDEIRAKLLHPRSSVKNGKGPQTV